MTGQVQRSGYSGGSDTSTCKYYQNLFQLCPQVTGIKHQETQTGLNVQMAGLAKSGTSKISLFAAMQSLYKKDRMFALQYLAASEISSKISYRSSQEDERREQSSLQNK